MLKILKSFVEFIVAVMQYLNDEAVENYVGSIFIGGGVSVTTYMLIKDIFIAFGCGLLTILIGVILFRRKQIYQYIRNLGADKECQETLNQLTYLINFDPLSNSNRAEKRRNEYAEKLMDKGIPATLLQDINCMNDCCIIIQELGLKKGIEEIKSKEIEILDI